ncbi:hypothetical protein ACFLQJ_01145, partial [Calditrichota bacterium]
MSPGAHDNINDPDNPNYNHAPNLPSNPYPADSSININTSVELTWTCSDPENDSLFYDVCFGIIDTPSIVSSYLQDTTFSVENLLFDTNYFWKIIARDHNENQTTGSLWTFRTTPNHPPMITDPEPEDGAVDVSIILTLSWRGSDPEGDSLTHTIYFSDSLNPSLVSENQQDSTFYPDTLFYNTTYYWRIVADDIQGNSTEGALWSFTTEVGPEMWTRTYDGDYASGRSVQQTSDGGYIITGSTYTGEDHDYDIRLTRFSAYGENLWNYTFGGADIDGSKSVKQISDGGFIIAGNTWSLGMGNSDVWLIKTDNFGNEEWNQTFGGGYSDRGNSVQQTSDGGFIIAGDTFGSGNSDVWLIKTNNQGNEEWSRTFGGNGDDRGFSVQQTYDGGFIIAGETESYGAGNYDAWLIKTDESGHEQWNHTFGGINSDNGVSVQQTSDGGFVIVGDTWSIGAGSSDIWLIKTSNQGYEDWNKTFGGNNYDRGFCVQ